MFFPTDVVYGPKGLFVSDSGNHRVLCWKEIPTENGQPADLVLGQVNFTDNKYNRGSEATNATLNDPYGMFLDQDPEDEDDPGRLFICDRGNSRIVVWEELPEPKSDEEIPEDELPPEAEDPELLMGHDDDFMDDDEDEEEDDPREIA